jgi:hypothetical protein
MAPSMMTCATCTPCGANSRASEELSARSANLGPEKLDIRALALMEAVAPVKIRVGEWVAGEAAASLRRKGKLAWEKMTAPFLVLTCQFVFRMTGPEVGWGWRSPYMVTAQLPS